VHHSCHKSGAGPKNIEQPRLEAIAPLSGRAAYVNAWVKTLDNNAYRAGLRVGVCPATDRHVGNV
jgi:hypothetical protein